MPLSTSFLDILQSGSSTDAWNAIFDELKATFEENFTTGKEESQVLERDRFASNIDLFLSTAGWDLWRQYEESVAQTSGRLKEWWSEQQGAKAILILDALSLRELPWIAKGATDRGFKVNVSVTGAEIPADTNPFAKRLGFGQRSKLENNGGKSKDFPDARVETSELPWVDCASQIQSEPNWIYWHQFPDHRLHDHDKPGSGLRTLTREIAENLTSDDFWSFIEKLTTGRKLVITADHGYAASELFSDAPKEQTEYLKDHFKSGRSTDDVAEEGQWLPPLDLIITGAHGKNRLALGRRKWKSKGGYPTLTHGGLSVLEVAVPFIEIEKGSH